MTQQQAWTVALIVGAVVIVAVGVLLTLLVAFVHTIDQRVASVRDTLKRAVTNTNDTTLIEQAAQAVDGVLAEGLQHHLFLGRVLGKVRA